MRHRLLLSRPNSRPLPVYSSKLFIRNTPRLLVSENQLRNHGSNAGTNLGRALLESLGGASSTPIFRIG